MIQDVVWDVSIVLMGSLAAVFIGVAAGAQVPLTNYGPAIARAYRLRVWLFALAMIVRPVFPEDVFTSVLKP